MQTPASYLYGVAMEHYRDLVAEAEQARLIKRATANRPAWFQRLRARLGALMVSAGLRLQGRLGDGDVAALESALQRC